MNPIIPELISIVVGERGTFFCMSDGAVQTNSVHKTKQFVFPLVHGCVLDCPLLYSTG